jgi:hypothetical protein
VQYNPCGQVIDVSAYDYTTPCVFNHDDVVETSRWVVMPDSTPVFDGWSRVCNLRWEPDADIFQDPIGEVWGAPRPYDTRVIPLLVRLAMGGHYCGTLEDFEQGGLYDPTKGDTKYGAYGFAACCGAPALIAGGGGASGYSPLLPVGVDPTRGGLAIGGSTGDQFSTTDPLVGGLDFGGSCGDSSELSDPAQGGMSLGGTGGDDFSGSDPTAGGLSFGGSAGDIFEQTDLIDGGFSIGGMVGDACDYNDGGAGGFRLGGSSGDDATFTDEGSGGVSIGGYVGDVQEASDSTAGGLSFGGSAGDDNELTDATEGGLAFGGECGDVFTPGSTIPGASCATAGNATIGTVYHSSIASPNEQWWVWPLTSTGLHTVNFTGCTGVVNWTIYHGTSCGTQVFVSSGSGNASPTVFSPVLETIYAKVTTVPVTGGTYNVQFV